MEKLKGYVDRIIYSNAENGYTVLNLIVDEDEVCCVGTFGKVDAGETLELEGDWTSHPMYGDQFKITSYHAVAADDVESVKRYLASGAIKGVGAALADRIVKKFGDDTFRIMEDEPERLVEVKGISERIAREISNQVSEKKDLRDAMLFLQQYGISNARAVKIFDKYGVGVYTVIKENPYRLAEDISGIGFNVADQIAEKVGIQADSEFRITCAMLHALSRAMGDGHVYLPRDVLEQETCALTGLGPDKLEGALERLAIERKVIVKDEDKVYHPGAYYAEQSCARLLLDLRDSIGVVGDGAGIRKRELQRLSELEDKAGMVLDELQEEAVIQSYLHGVFVLSGGPGTGKTTTINMMLKLFEEEGLDFYLAAPTGRAAKRMSEATGYEAKTIHRLLELSGDLADTEGLRNGRFERNEENPLEADVVIIDEMSMVDIFLLQALLKAIPYGTRLILVGDVNQLPSVGAGEVLSDIMKSGAFPSVVLEKIYRQDEDSHIVVNAHKINRGEEIALDNKSKDFFFLERNQVPVIYKHMVELISDKLPKYLNVKPQEIQVLTPMKKGDLGTEELNRVLQQYLNPPAPDKKEYKSGDDRLFREGDKVMQIKNNYQIEWEVRSKYGIPIDSGVGVFNGDVGSIKKIDNNNQTITVEYEEGKQVDYTYSMLDELELAYAITVHKSQGSEYPAVVMPLLVGPRMLMNRNLLYTAITRAKNLVTILGSKEAVYTMIRNKRENERYTSLDERIRELDLQEK